MSSRKRPAPSSSGAKKRSKTRRPRDFHREELEAEEPSSTLDDLVFEDPFGDDIASEDDGGEEDAEGSDSDGDRDGGAAGGAGNATKAVDAIDDEEEEEAPVQVWRPGVDPLGEDEELDYRSEAYVMFHRLRMEWPCLSFDVFPDKLGTGRTRFPLSMYLVTGPQASDGTSNELLMMRVSDLCRTQHDSDSECDDSDAEDDPTLAVQRVPHPGGVNRVRTMPQWPHVVATWSDRGAVHVWDVRPGMASLDASTRSEGALGLEAGAELRKTLPARRQAFARQAFVHDRHSDEGFAMDWSPVAPGRLATGDCAAGLFVWDPLAAGGSSDGVDGATWRVRDDAYRGHEGSVEDIQWSPNEADVFASCGVDGSLRIWDVRGPTGSMQSLQASDTDVNVISWNAKVSPLIASGDDHGTFKVWDMRQFDADRPVSRFQWHSAPITSLEWDPHDASCLTVSSADNTISVWDMSLESEDVAAAGAGAGGGGGGDDGAPPQLLFLHQGQTDVKEVHFHPQLPGVIVSTAFDGFNFFKPDVQL